MPWTTRLTRASLFVEEFFVLWAVAFLPFSKSAVEIGVFTGLGLWVLRKALLKETLGAPREFKAFYALFLLITLFSLFQVSPAATPAAVRGFFKWLKYIGLFFMAAEWFQDPAKTRRLVGVFLVSVFFLTVNGFYQIWFGLDLIKGYSVDIPGRLIRMKSSLGSPNDLATFYLMAIPLVFWLWARERKWSWRSAAPLALLLFFFSALVMTLSRSGLFALFLAVFGYALIRRAFLAAGGMLCLGMAFILSSELLRLNFLHSLNLRDITIAERFAFWQVTWALIQKAPLLGHGVNTYFSNFAAFAPASETYRGYAHNCYLQMWSEVGILGLLAFLAPLLFGFWKGRSFPLKDVLRVGLAAYLIQSFFDTNFYAIQASVLFWVFWGMAAALKDEKAFS